MNRALRISLLAAVPAMLTGHALASRVGTAYLGLPEHAVYLHALELSLVPGLTLLVAFSLLRVLNPYRENHDFNARQLALGLLPAQLLGYLGLEAIEHHPTGWIGFATQILCGMITLLILRAIATWFDRCAKLGNHLAHSRYHRGIGTGLAPAFIPVRVLVKTTRAYARQWSRPPPPYSHHR